MRIIWSSTGSNLPIDLLYLKYGSAPSLDTEVFNPLKRNCVIQKDVLEKKTFRKYGTSFFSFILNCFGDEQFPKDGTILEKNTELFIPLNDNGDEEFRHGTII